MAIQFDNSLRTGNELIDTQHQELIARVNKLTEECKPGTEKTVAAQTLGFLMDYTNEHFSDEEKLQEEHNYPLLNAHKEQHACFVKAVNELEEMLIEEEGPSEAFVAAVKKNVVDWLLNHIMVWDKQVAQYVIEK
ncbi:MAG: bacteriohemerythrin [Marvinbryantia sp.]|jgi:hemerythrin